MSLDPLYDLYHLRKIFRLFQLLYKTLTKEIILKENLKKEYLNINSLIIFLSFDFEI